MKKLAKFSLISVLFQSVLMLATMIPALAHSSASLAGSVFVDSNANLMAEPDEVNLANAMVYVRLQSDPAVIYTAITDAGGNYVFANLPCGTYEAWAEDTRHNVTPMRTVELAEVNAAVTVDFPVIDNSADIELTSIRQIFLPLIFGN